VAHAHALACTQPMVTRAPHQLAVLTEPTPEGAVSTNGRPTHMLLPSAQAEAAARPWAAERHRACACVMLRRRAVGGGYAPAVERAAPARAAVGEPPVRPDPPVLQQQDARQPAPAHLARSVPAAVLVLHAARRMWQPPSAQSTPVERFSAGRHGPPRRRHAWLHDDGTAWPVCRSNCSATQHPIQGVKPHTPRTTGTASDKG
jgi:hypothetical protein